MDKETQKKIASCKALQGVTLAQFINLPRFRENLAAYMAAQREDREKSRASYEAMRKLGGAKGYRLPAHVCDKLVVLSAGEFAAEFLAVLTGCSTRPRREREYLRQLGLQAYNLTVAQIVVEEFPELKDKLLPKSNVN